MTRETDVPPRADAEDLDDESGWVQDSGTMMEVPDRERGPKTAREAADRQQDAAVEAARQEAAPADDDQDDQDAPESGGDVEASGAAPEGSDERSSDGVEAARQQPPRRHRRTAEGRKDELQREINRLVAQREEERRQIEALRQQREALGQAAGRPPQTEGASSPPPASGGAPGVQSPPSDPEPTIDQFGGDWEKWDAARFDWLKRQVTARSATAGEQLTPDQVDQRVEARLQYERAEAAQRARTERLNTDEARLAQEHPDFHERISAAYQNEDGTPIHNIKWLADIWTNTQDGARFAYDLAANPQDVAVLASLEPTQPVRDAIIASPSSHALLRHFIQHPAEFERMKVMHPTLMFQQMGYLAGRLEQQTPAAPNGNNGGTAAPDQPKLSTAPPPPTPPRGTPRARGAPRSYQDLPPGDDGFEEFFDMENANETARRRRELGLT